ncbi:hypothetical protein GE09DRAFT_435504 [Coniochaeta sp. 2T2.1]|nr:hypothetical protein GE09DRAFT_435504 [Coniochaeta sp. 2T2.1]
MSGVNAAAVHPYRRKVTLACDSCRKRRVKCSGTEPCALCSESGRQCEFDSKNRARRGPRPRQTASQTQRIIHPLAPRITAGTVWHPPEEREIRVAAEHTERVVSDHGNNDNETTNREGEDDLTGFDGDDDNEDGDSADGEDDVPDPLVWRPGLEDLLSRNNSISKSLPVLDPDLVCHLIHLFCTRATAQLRLLVPLDQIQDGLSQGTMSAALVLAMCASGMRFSVHKAVRACQSPELADVVEKETQRCLRASRATWQQIDSVKTVCILVDYEASRAHGRQAWINIAMGRSLVQLARSARDLDAEQTRVLDVAERYLAITQTSHSLGHRHLQPRAEKVHKRPRLHCAPCPEDCPHLIELLEIFASVHRLCLTPFREHNPAPWAAGSEFRALQDELEEYLLRHPVTFRFGSNSPSAGFNAKQRKQGDLDASISSMVWHCCVIALNRTFLPIPERRPWTDGGAGGQNKPTTLHSVIEFPGAPPLFLNERVHRCESSADAICSISRDVIKNGGFYSHAVLVGFACAQSALVSINRLHRSSKPYDDRIVENLKDAFIVLGAVQTFYAPAKDWMDAVLRAHDTNTTRLSHLDGSGTSDLSFNSYFDRFLDLEEPAFMPLDPRDGGIPWEDPSIGDRDSGGEVQNVNEALPEETVPEDTSSVWLQAYTEHLCGDIDVDDMDEQNSRDQSQACPAVQGTESLPPTQQLPPSPQPRTNIPPSVDEAREPDFTNLAPQEPEESVHMAGAILASMPGGTPSFMLQAPEQADSNMHDAFSDLFGQFPAFDMPTPTSMFTGLGAGGDGNMWFDMMNHQMMK